MDTQIRPRALWATDDGLQQKHALWAVAAHDAAALTDALCRALGGRRMAAALLNSNRQTTTKFTAICHAKLHTDRTQHRQATHTVAYSDAGTAAGTQGVRAAAGAQEMQATAGTAAIYPDTGTVTKGFCYLDMLIVKEVVAEAKQNKQQNKQQNEQQNEQHNKQQNKQHNKQEQQPQQQTRQQQHHQHHMREAAVSAQHASERVVFERQNNSSNRIKRTAEQGASAATTTTN